MFPEGSMIGLRDCCEVPQPEREGHKQNAEAPNTPGDPRFVLQAIQAGGRHDPVRGKDAEQTRYRQVDHGLTVREPEQDKHDKESDGVGDMPPLQTQQERWLMPRREWHNRSGCSSVRPSGRMRDGGSGGWLPEKISAFFGASNNNLQKRIYTPHCERATSIGTVSPFIQP
jgi:hypothetical protein